VSSCSWGGAADLRLGGEHCVPGGARLEAARAVWDAVGEPMLSGADAGPAGLLRAERAIVEFTGREAQLAELRGWYESYGSYRTVHTEPVLQGLHLYGHSRATWLPRGQSSGAGHPQRSGRR
jgi:hypothetical protein